MSTLCDRCGKEVFIGEWPFCPHGFGNNLQKPMEPYTDEHIGSSPVEFRTIGEKVKYMDKHAIVQRREAPRDGRASVALKQSDIRGAIRETIREIRG